MPQRVPNEQHGNSETQLPVRNHIFISYRRDDARGASGRLYDWLRIGFGRERVFRDVHSIGVGKWRDKIDRALKRCAVCVAVIGPRWANADNLPRLHDESDMVRHELVTALASDEITLVPTAIRHGRGCGDLSTECLTFVNNHVLDLNAFQVHAVSSLHWRANVRRIGSRDSG